LNIFTVNCKIRRQKLLQKFMYKGIIYRYYLVNEKGIEMSYIGQTCAEKKKTF